MWDSKLRFAIARRETIFSRITGEHVPTFIGPVGPRTENGEIMFAGSVDGWMLGPPMITCSCWGAQPSIWIPFLVDICALDPTSNRRLSENKLSGNLGDVPLNRVGTGLDNREMTTGDVEVRIRAARERSSTARRNRHPARVDIGSEELNAKGSRWLNAASKMVGMVQIASNIGFQDVRCHRTSNSAWPARR